MARSEVTDEVRVLRFFETGPIDKVEAVFNIVCEKMRERLQERNPGGTEIPIRKRRNHRAVLEPGKEIMERGDASG